MELFKIALKQINAEQDESVIVSTGGFEAELSKNGTIELKFVLENEYVMLNEK